MRILVLLTVNEKSLMYCLYVEIRRSRGKNTKRTKVILLYVRGHFERHLIAENMNIKSIVYSYTVHI